MDFDSNHTLVDQIVLLIKDNANNNPAPEKCIIKKVYDDGCVDIVLDNSFVVKYVHCLGSPVFGSDGVVVFLEGDDNKPIVLTGGVGDVYTKSEIDNIVDGIVSGSIDLSGYVSEDELNGILSSYVVSSTLSDYALRSELFSGSYNDLTEKPSIPTKTSDLTNDSGFLTTHQSLNNYYRKSEVDNGFAVKNHTHSQYLTEHQSLSDYLTETEINQLLSSYALSSALNNYYTKAEADNKYSELGHSHTKSDISDFAHTHEASQINVAYNNKNGSLIYGNLDTYVTETEEIIAQIDVPSKLSEILTHIVQYYDYYQ